MEHETLQDPVGLEAGNAEDSFRDGNPGLAEDTTPVEHHRASLETLALLVDHLEGQSLAQEVVDKGTGMEVDPESVEVVLVDSLEIQSCLVELFGQICFDYCFGSAESVEMFEKGEDRSKNDISLLEPP